MQSSAFSSTKRVRELAAYSAIAIAVVMAAAISPMGSNLALVIGLGAFVGLVGVGSVFPLQILAKAALVSAVWASIYGLKAIGVPLLEIPVYLAIGGLGLAFAFHHGHLPSHQSSDFLSRASARWNIWRSHFKTTAVLTMAFSAVSVIVLWYLEGAGIDNILPIVVTIAVATLGTRFVTGPGGSLKWSARRSIEPKSSKPSAAKSIFWILSTAITLIGLGIFVLFGSHQGVANAMGSNLGFGETNEPQHSRQRTLDGSITAFAGTQSIESFTSHPSKEDCPLDETGVRFCDPVNLVFPGQTLNEVKLSLLSAGWITSTRRGSAQYLRWGGQDYHQQDLQLHFYESLRARYHVRLWQAPDRTMVVGAVHHDAGLIYHSIEIDWDEAQQFVANQLCNDQCALSNVLANHSSIQGKTDSWRAVGNDGRATIIATSK